MKNNIYKTVFCGNFDTVCAVDWSGAKQILNPAIQVASVRKSDDYVTLIAPKTGRFWSRTAFAGYLAELAAIQNRVLVGVDCNFSLASATLARLGCNDASSLWRYIDDICTNDTNYDANYYAGAFWRKHPDLFWTAGKQPDWFDSYATSRLTDRMSDSLPESPQKLVGAKQVGRGGLAMMRVLAQVCQLDGVAVWPFSGREACNRANLVMAEIHPRLFLDMAGHARTKLETPQAVNQVLGYFGAYRYHDTNDKISGDAADALISAAGMMACLHQPDNAITGGDHIYGNQQIMREGWVFGMPFPRDISSHEE